MVITCSFLLPENLSLTLTHTHSHVSLSLGFRKRQQRFQTTTTTYLSSNVPELSRIFLRLLFTDRTTHQQGGVLWIPTCPCGICWRRLAYGGVGLDQGKE